MNNKEQLYSRFKEDVKERFIDYYAQESAKPGNEEKYYDAFNIKEYNAIKAIIQQITSEEAINKWLPKILNYDEHFLMFLVNAGKGSIQHTLELVVIDPKHSELFAFFPVVLDKAQKRLKPYKDKLTNEQKKWLE
jgi:hypothetical protein